MSRSVMLTVKHFFLFQTDAMYLPERLSYLVNKKLLPNCCNSIQSSNLHTYEALTLFTLKAATTMDFQLINASSPDYKDVINNMMQFYIYDFSPYVDYDVEADGLFKPYPSLEDYWKETD